MRYTPELARRELGRRVDATNFPSAEDPLAVLIAEYDAMREALTRDGYPIVAGYVQPTRRRTFSREDITADEAHPELVRILDLDPGASWADVVTYTAKARGTITMAMNTVRRRIRVLADAMGHPAPDDATWPEALELAQHAYTNQRNPT